MKELLEDMDYDCLEEEDFLDDDRRWDDPDESNGGRDPYLDPGFSSWQDYMNYMYG